MKCERQRLASENWWISTGRGGGSGGGPNLTEAVANDIIDVIYVPTLLQLADMLTNIVPVLIIFIEPAAKRKTQLSVEKVEKASVFEFGRLFCLHISSNWNIWSRLM